MLVGSMYKSFFFLQCSMYTRTYSDSRKQAEHFYTVQLHIIDPAKHALVTNDRASGSSPGPFPAVRTPPARPLARWPITSPVLIVKWSEVGPLVASASLQPNPRWESIQESYNG